jgi:hypothetical protein
VIKKTIKILIFVLFLAFLFSLLQENGYFSLTRKQVKVLLGEEELNVWVSETNKEKARGLSGTEKMEENEGMLFIFPIESTPSFWMKEMFFPVDIVWINSEKEIIEITEKVFPESYPELIIPQNKIKYVVEVVGGWTKDKGVKIGDKLILSEKL